MQILILIICPGRCTSEMTTYLKPPSHQALARNCLILQSAVGSHENLDILVKRAVNASLQPPYSDYGVATELTWRSIAYLAVLFGDSLRSHGAFTAFTLQAMCFHGVCTALSRPWRVEGAVASQNKEEGKDQESMQLSTTPDQDTVGESDKTKENITNRRAKRSAFPNGYQRQKKRSTKEAPPWNGR